MQYSVSIYTARNGYRQCSIWTRTVPYMDIHCTAYGYILCSIWICTACLCTVNLYKSEHRAPPPVTFRRFRSTGKAGRRPPRRRRRRTDRPTRGPGRRPRSQHRGDGGLGGGGGAVRRRAGAGPAQPGEEAAAAGLRGARLSTHSQSHNVSLFPPPLPPYTRALAHAISGAGSTCGDRRAARDRAHNHNRTMMHIDEYKRRRRTPHTCRVESP
jgi:hypothetical protein